MRKDGNGPFARSLIILGIQMKLLCSPRHTAMRFNLGKSLLMKLNGPINGSAVGGGKRCEERGRERERQDTRHGQGWWEVKGENREAEMNGTIRFPSHLCRFAKQ